MFARKQQLWVITHHGHISTSALIAPDGILREKYRTQKNVDSQAPAQQYIQGGARNAISLVVHNTFLSLQKNLTPVTELILKGWKIVHNEEHVHCDHRFASQPHANEPLHVSQLFDTSLQKARGTTSLCGP